jgi:hypothetical protein
MALGREYISVARTKAARTSFACLVFSVMTI